MAAARARHAVLFDVDGTLVDSTHLHTVAWWEACRQAGHLVPSRSVHRAIGLGSDQLLDHLLPAGRDRSADAGMVSAHATLYAEFWERLAPLDGARALLRACAAAGWTVVLASSAHGRELVATRSALDVDDAITAVTAADDVSHSKPAPDLVNQGLELADATPDEAVFVGDAVWDIEACQRAGVQCLGVASGAYGRDELHAAGAYQTYGSLRQLLEQRASSLLAD